MPRIAYNRNIIRGKPTKRKSKRTTKKRNRVTPPPKVVNPTPAKPKVIPKTKPKVPPKQSPINPQKQLIRELELWSKAELQEYCNEKDIEYKSRDTKPMLRQYIIDSL